MVVQHGDLCGQGPAPYVDINGLFYGKQLLWVITHKLKHTYGYYFPISAKSVLLDATTYYALSLKEYPAIIIM